MHVCLCMLNRLSHVRLFVTLWTVVYQVPLSTEFSRQEYCSELPCSTPGDLSDPGIELTSLMSSALTARFFTTSVTWEAHDVLSQDMSTRVFNQGSLTAS